MFGFELGEEFCRWANSALLHIFQSLANSFEGIGAGGNVLADTLKRNARAVSRDIDLLESFGLLRTRYVPNPGHGRRRIVESAAEKYQLIASI